MKRTSKTPSKYAIVKGVEMRGDAEICLRTVDGLFEYRRRLHVMISRQLNKCARCGKPSNELYFDHQDGRGMNGSCRNDSIWTEDGRPYNAALCANCNSEKASRRFSWIDGCYQEVQRSDG